MTASSIDRSATSQALSRTERLLFVLALGVLALPTAVVTHPPMVDLAQHAAQVDMMVRYDDPVCQFDARVEPNWLSPYLAGYLLAFGLAQLVSVPAAIKLTVLGAVLAIPIAFRVFLRAAQRPAVWSFLGFPIAWSFSAHWGFLSLMVGIPVALLFLAQVLRYAARPSPVRGIGIGLFALVVFACHVLLSLFSIGIAVLLVLRAAPSPRHAMVRSLPLVGVLPIAIGWLRAMQSTHDEASGVVWGTEAMRAGELLSRLVGEPATLSASLVGLALVLAPVLGGGRFSRRALDWLPLYATIVWFLIAPRALFGVIQIYARFHVFTLPLLLLAVEPPTRIARRWRALPIVLALGWGLVVTGRWTSFERESADFRRLLDAMEPARHAYSLILDPDSRFASTPAYLHFPIWYQTNGGCLTEPSFAFAFAIFLRYPPDVESRLPIGIGFAPELLEVDRYLDRRFDNIVVRASEDPRDGVLEGLDLEIEQRFGRWWLLRWPSPPNARTP